MKAIFIAFLLLASMAFLLSSATLATREIQPIKGDEKGYIKASDPYRFRRRIRGGGRRPPPPPSAVGSDLYRRRR
ncbi:hypothetical protein AAHE18_14G237600 [Arachis hypogaea]